MTHLRSRTHRGMFAAVGIAVLMPLATTTAGATPQAPTQDATPSDTTVMAPPSGPTQDDLRLNELQFLGSHNSYHLPPFPGLYDFATTVAPDGLNPKELLYEHAPLPEQFSSEGIRQIELDISADPDGGRYSAPAANLLTGVEPYKDTYEAWNPPELDEPGTKVLHIPDFDMRTTCVLLTQCLTQIKDWSSAHPGHFPIAVLIEAKDEAIGGDFPIDLVEPLPYTAARLDDLDAEIRTVFDEDEVFTPDDLRGDAETLDEVVTEDGWPTLETMRSQVMFMMDNGGAIADRYRDGHPALEGRVMFTSGTPGDPDAAFIKLNNPVNDAETINEAVEAGYVVRTRADEPIGQAQSGDTTMQDAAFASGAQWVSTDYPVSGLTELLDDYGLPFADYSSPLPPNEPPPSQAPTGSLRSGTIRNAEAGGPRLARCNPVSAPAFCYDLALTEPDPPEQPTPPTVVLPPETRPIPTSAPSSPNDPPDGNDPNATDNNNTTGSSNPNETGPFGTAVPLAPQFTG